MRFTMLLCVSIALVCCLGPAKADKSGDSLGQIMDLLKKVMESPSNDQVKLTKKAYPIPVKANTFDNTVVDDEKTVISLLDEEKEIRPKNTSKTSVSEGKTSTTSEARIGYGPVRRVVRPYVPSRGFRHPAQRSQPFKSLLGLTMYFGNCPTNSRKVARRLDSLYLCRSGGNFHCDEECERKFDDDDEEVLGGRCLNPGRKGYGDGYGQNGGYTGYGRGEGVSDTKCMEKLEEETLDDDDFQSPLCNLQSNEFDEQDDEAVFRSRSYTAPFAGRGPRIHDSDLIHHPVNSKRCSDKCFLKYSNAEKGLCRKRGSYLYECVCLTCGDAEAFYPNDLEGTVYCADITPEGNTFAVPLPVTKPVSITTCIGDADEARVRCTNACLQHFMHNPVSEGTCKDTGDPVDDTCDCQLCHYPRCIYDSWNDWSYCSVRCNGGTRRRKRNLISGSKNVCTNIRDYRSCGEYPCAVDCEVADWGVWSRCHGYCGTGEEVRRRQVLTPPMYGGRCVFYSFVERRRCETGVPCETGPPIPQPYGPRGAPIDLIGPGLQQQNGAPGLQQPNGVQYLGQ